MKKLIEELKTEGMTMNDLYAIFEYNMATPIVGGLLGALFLSAIASSNTYYCSMNEKYLYYFKVSNTFSYKGIKKDTICKIALSSISKIIWKPKVGFGYFEIMFFGGRLKGSLCGAYEIKDNFMEMLRYIQKHHNVICVGYGNKKIVI